MGKSKGWATKVKIKSGAINIAMLVALFLVIGAVVTNSATYASALQATQGAATTVPAIPTAVPLLPSMLNSLVPCADGVTGPCDLVATKLDDVVGIWKQYLVDVYFNAPGGIAFTRYNADGTYNIADSIEDTAQPFKDWPTGRFSFDGTQMTLGVMAGSPAPCDGAGVYQIRVLKFGNKPVALRYIAISDTCTPRLQDLIQASVWVAPNTK